MPKRDKARQSADSSTWVIYGRHAVRAALRNPKRHIEALLVTDESADDDLRKLAEARQIPIRPTSKTEMTELLGAAVHQGVALEVQALSQPSFREFVKGLQKRPHATVLLADRISDPQNIGAIVRNMAAFGACGLILPTHHAPNSATGALAKAAAGAVETMPIFQQTNLAQALRVLQKNGFWCYAAASSGETALADADLPSHCAFVLGSEGEGVRPLVLKTCDAVLRIPMVESGAEAETDGLGSINVSAAAAIILYQRFLKLA